MELSLKIDQNSTTPYQTQIVDQLIQLILTGCLRPSDRLPSSRDLGEQIQVSRNTIKGAYDKLITEGYIETRIGAGTFVCKNIPENTIKLAEELSPAKDLKNSDPIELPERSNLNNQDQLYLWKQDKTFYDFQIERSDPHTFPVNIWRRLINQQLNFAKVNMTRYGEPNGLATLRTAISARLGATRGIHVEADQIIILTGIQQGLNIVSHLFVRKGSRVVLESPGYQGANAVFKNYGADILPVNVDRNGINPTTLPSERIDLAMVTPSRHFPLSATLPLERRKALVDWAGETGSYLLEVDYDSDFRYEGPPLRAVKSFDQFGRVIYLSSFAKSIGPGLRMGYMVVPEGLLEHAKSSKILLDYGLPWLDQAVLSEFLSSGSFDNHVKRIRQLYLERRNCLYNALKTYMGDIDVTGLDCGTYLVCRLPKNSIDAETLQSEASKKNIGIYTLSHHTIFNGESAIDHKRVFLLGYAGLTETKIEKAISLLANLTNTK